MSYMYQSQHVRVDMKLDRVDIIFAATILGVYTYRSFGRVAAIACIAAFVALSVAFSPPLAAIVLTSALLAHHVVSRRVLRTASAGTQTYATIALSALFASFALASLTGFLEPYQAGVIFILAYVFQARYRTSTITGASVDSVGIPL